MKKFKLTKDSKCTIWFREIVEVEAETKEDAIKKVIQSENSGEYLIDTAENLSIEENQGYSTIEIYEDTMNDSIYKNGK